MLLIILEVLIISQECKQGVYDLTVIRGEGLNKRHSKIKKVSLLKGLSFDYSFLNYYSKLNKDLTNTDKCLCLHLSVFRTNVKAEYFLFAKIYRGESLV